MEIILLDNIDELGIVGQKVKVKDGYGRNYLLPRKLACLATQKNLNHYSGLIESKKKKLAKAKASAEDQAKLLSGLMLTFLRKSRDADSRLFGSVTNVDVAQALEEKGYEIERKRIAITEPVKKLGEYTATVRLHPEVTASVKFQVQAEEKTRDAG
jgi:large subunit ribosomal protein L9